MKSIKILVLGSSIVAVLLLPWLWGATTSVSSGRFQLVFGKVEQRINKNTYETPVCFKIDTETGTVWQYEYSDYSDANGCVNHFGFVFVPQGETVMDIVTLGRKSKDFSGYEIYFSNGKYLPGKEPNFTGKSEESKTFKERLEALKKEPNEKRGGID